jgi:hypothetical protein
MLRLRSFRAIALTAGATLLASLHAGAAHAIINGNASTLSQHMVRVIGRTGKPNCSGVALDRTHVITAAHCHPRFVFVDGKRIAIARIAQSALLDDGKRVMVKGDALILTLRANLPATVLPIAIGEQGGDGRYTIAGFGAVVEADRGKLGPLHEAAVVHFEPLRLVDPQRDGELSASACYGDSGGAVVRNGMLIGIITRASHPHPRKVCGHLTHYVPVIATGAGPLPAQAAATLVTRIATRRVKSRRVMRR